MITLHKLFRPARKTQFCKWRQTVTTSSLIATLIGNTSLIGGIKLSTRTWPIFINSTRDSLANSSPQTLTCWTVFFVCPTHCQKAAPKLFDFFQRHSMPNTSFLLCKSHAVGGTTSSTAQTRMFKNFRTHAS